MNLDYQLLAIAVVEGVFSTELVKRFFPLEGNSKKRAIYAAISVIALLACGATAAIQPKPVMMMILAVTVGTALYDSVIKSVSKVFDAIVGRVGLCPRSGFRGT